MLPIRDEYRGPFGALVEVAVRHHTVDVNVPLPTVVYRCIQFLDHQNAVAEEGIFRLSGSNVVIKQLRERFNTEGDVDLINNRMSYDIHAVASLLKLYLRELPTAILTGDVGLKDFAVTESPQDMALALRELLQGIPRENTILFKYIMAFLVRVTDNSARNKMTVHNISVIFSPTLRINGTLITMILQNYQDIFDESPEKYRLASSTSCQRV